MYLCAVAHQIKNTFAHVGGWGCSRYIIMTDEHPCCPDAHKMDTPTLFGTLAW